jgi:hypothetical protein
MREQKDFILEKKVFLSLCNHNKKNVNHQRTYRLPAIMLAPLPLQ